MISKSVRGAKVIIRLQLYDSDKVKVIEYLDDLGESASLMGAVNCVVRRDGKWIGENTDGKGFVFSSGTHRSQGKKGVIFGAWGGPSYFC